MRKTSSRPQLGGRGSGRERTLRTKKAALTRADGGDLAVRLWAFALRHADIVHGAFAGAFVDGGGELDLVAFVDALEAAALEGGDVDEHVVAAAFWRDKAEAFCGVEEFDRAGRHI